MTTDTNDKYPPPEEGIRSDLWPTMSVGQLHRQQELILGDVTKLQTMTPFGVPSSPGADTLLRALQQAMVDIVQLIDARSANQSKPKKTPHGQ